MRAGRYDDLPLVLRQSSEAQAAVHGQPPADASGATPPTPGRTALARGKWLLVIPVAALVVTGLFYPCLLYTSDAADDPTLCRSRWSPYH